MSDTPLTDAATRKFCGIGVRVESCKNIERRLNEAKAVIAHLHENRQQKIKAYQERDRLRAELEETKVLLHQVGRGEVDSVLRRERDELRAVIEAAMKGYIDAQKGKNK